MAESRPLIFRGKSIGHMRIEPDGQVTGRIDPEMLSQLETMDLFWHAWTDRYILETESDQ